MGLCARVEGGIIQSTSWTLRESISYDSTRILTGSWEDYSILHMTEVPSVEVSLIDRPEERAVGAASAPRDRRRRRSRTPSLMRRGAGFATFPSRQSA